MRKIDKESGHRAIIAAGPANHGFVKIFRASDADDLSRRMQQFNFDRVVLRRIAWCVSDVDANILKAAIDHLMGDQYPIAAGGFYECASVNMDLMLGQAFQTAADGAGVPVFTIEQRMQWLQRETARRTDRVMQAAERCDGRGMW